MKSLYLLVFLFFSYPVFACNQEIQSDFKDARKLVIDVKNFLDQFQVARHYKETKKDFLQRLKADKKFTDVSYGICSSFILQGGKLKLEKDKKKHLLGLFIDNSYCVKECGFWGGDEDGFYVSPTTKVVGKGLARFKEKGKFEWFISFPNGRSGNEFLNTPIQDLIDFIDRQLEIKVTISLDTSTAVVFTKEENVIISRLQYK